MSGSKPVDKLEKSLEPLAITVSEADIVEDEDDDLESDDEEASDDEDDHPGDADESISADVGL